MKNQSQFLKILVTFPLVSVLLLGCGSPSASRDLNTWIGANDNAEGFKQVDGTHKLTFPVDHGPHDDYLFEWWYLTALLNDQSGREFGVQFTVFRRALTTDSDVSNPWRSGQVYLGHLAMSDIQEKTHQVEERFSRGHPELAGALAEPFRVYVEDWSLASTTVSYFPLKLVAGTRDYRVSLVVNRGKPMILHGIDGYSQKSSDHASYYYTHSRLPTRGTLEIDGQEHTVSGTAWLDREWSSQILDDPYRGWYWFSLNFDDGRELVLFELHSDDSSVKTIPTATWIELDGSSSSVVADTWSIKPRRYWKSYPVEWVLEIDGTHYVIEAEFDDQFMSTSISYWEGVVEVTESDKVVGHGYMELTGYE
ncbi:MAG: hypothetical protein F4Z01_01620 [Gammaproteobacteria bacterium]|nr:hypothetical protein [Gammaproteobacteria bacterium]MYF37473.1 hypothetical protein [Gammaproteobacteria bacterium]